MHPAGHPAQPVQRYHLIQYARLARVRQIDKGKRRLRFFDGPHEGQVQILVAQHGRHVVIGLGIGFALHDGFFIMLQRFIAAVERAQRISEVVVGLGVTVIQGQCFFVVFGRFIKLALVIVNNAHVVVGLGVIRVDADRFAQTKGGLVGVAALAFDLAQIGMVLGNIRADFDRLFDRFHRAGIIALGLQDNPVEVPGIGLFGAILGGLAAGSLYAYLNKFPIGKLADLTSPALLLSQATGRIGDIINGEHCSTSTTMPWGFVYNHPNSPAFSCFANLRNATPATHPAVLYELIWDLVILGVLWKLRGRLAPPGMLFALYGMLYALGRFFLQFLRLDKEWFAGLQEAHIISLIVMAITVSILASRVRWVQREEIPQRQDVPRRPRPRSKARS